MRAQLDPDVGERFLTLRRQLVNRGPGRLVLLALGAEGDHQGRDGEAFGSWEDDVPTSPQELPLPADLDPAELSSEDQTQEER